MFNWFKQKPTLPKTLHLKSNDAAFEYAVRFLPRPILKDGILFGQIIDPVENGVLRQQRYWRIRLATEHGIMETTKCGSILEDLNAKLKFKSPELKAGDLVAVQVGAYNPQYGLDNPLQYFMIISKLKPEIDLERHIMLPDI